MNHKSLKMMGSLTLISTISAFLLQMVVLYTQPIIAKNQALYLKQAIYEILPNTASVQGYRLQEGRFIRSDLPNPSVFAALDAQKKTLAFLFQWQGQGYQELMKILVAYDPVSKKLQGIKVLESKETPGLGERILTDQAFLAQFQGLAMPFNQERQELRHPLQLALRGKPKQPGRIDGITGATISSKAVLRIVNQGARYYFPLLQKTGGGK